jgi:hypothetical protein
MTREEEIEKEAEKYAYKGVDDEFKPMVKGIAIYLIDAFKTGAEFADQHQKEGLWDSQKVCNILRNKMDSNWFYEKMERADYDSIIEDLRKAMEE